jgi:hypothetical protein
MQPWPRGVILEFTWGTEEKHETLPQDKLCPNRELQTASAKRYSNTNLFTDSLITKTM